MNAHHPMNDEETAASLSGGAKTDALRALRMLSETAETPSDDTETPPLPARLRDLWQETYGEDAKPAPVPVAAGEGWLRRLARVLATRAAWAGGLAATAAIALLIYNHDPGTEKTGDKIVTCGTSHGTGDTGAAARLVVVAPADKAGPLMQELARAYPSRRIERADSPPTGVDGDDAIIIDAVARRIRRAGQPAGAELSEDPLTNPALVIMAIEGMDEPAPR